MAAIKPYPHFEINVKDNSIYTVTYEEILPVHRALWVMKAQEGPCGDPTWCSTFSEAKAIFGAETFKPANKLYFSPQAQFLLETLTYNGAFICRAADGGAEAQIILEAWVKDKAITQYQLDADGNRLVDDNGDFIPMKNGDADVTEAGVEITFRTRTELTSAEIAAGSDLGSLGGTVTKGILSAKGRSIVIGDYQMTLLQADTAINPGNSGGGLFNMKGELIGVVNAKTADEEIEGICFAIPINIAKKVFNDLSVRFKDRNGGYTRILKLDERRGDDALMVILEIVEGK